MPNMSATGLNKSIRKDKGHGGLITDKVLTT